ncbi:type 1 glutamine amidotransferase [Cellulomonas sp. H30R-01]|uniref:type 1 glutamine amidotransferase domain-containing protein n=1 Tax=Cellulomonas sp. H30R-01 TaxID=2704467 RepID=UPI00138DA069|nr:type 1 glutamine amidotransferase domain-containing protein [Cellulomonas sp. H30R-01]QHT57605.1 type 1 glutamine amidotransferase [Cellulomonas sp. H30R-01]
MSESTLTGRRVLAIVTNYGVEQDELVVPVDHLSDQGVDVTVAAQSSDPVQTLVGDKDPGRTVTPDTTFADVDAGDYDLLLVPGGTINADTLRLDEQAVGLVRAFAASGRPIAAICHGPWALVEAGVLGGVTLTSYPSLRTDVRNAGGEWRDQEVVTDDAGGFPLVTSRNPDDLPAFLPAVDKVLAAQVARS